MIEKPEYAWCAECGDRFIRLPYTRRFCSHVCRKKHNERRLCGGLRLYDAAMRWRLDNTRSKKGLLTELTQAADLLAMEEREIKAKRKTRIEEQRSQKLRVS